MNAPKPNFDRIARHYGWLEYLTLGRALERCRLHFLPQLTDRRNALVLGDGDGRFLAQFLVQNHESAATAVDTSAAMLKLLESRCVAHRDRLTTHRTGALEFTPTGPYDLVCTHFFLDCLSQSQVDALASRLAPALSPNACWLFSDFRIPPAGPMRWPAQLLISYLYLVFHILTGLRTSRLPDHASALTCAGFGRIDRQLSLFGMLTTELWTLDPAPCGKIVTAR